MSKTDGMLLNKISSISDDKIENLTFASSILWAISPLLMIFLNFFKVSSYTFHGIITILLYFSGCIGLLFGILYVARFIKKNSDNLDCLIEQLKPVILMILFLLWSVFCTFFAEEKRIAIYGYGSMKDNLFTFLFFVGLFLSGLSFSTNKNKVDIWKYLFLAIAVFVSVTSFFEVNLISSEFTVDANSSRENSIYFSEYIALPLLIIFGDFFCDLKSYLISLVIIPVLLLPLIKYGDSTILVILVILITFISAIRLLRDNKEIKLEVAVLFFEMLLVIAIIVLADNNISFAGIFQNALVSLKGEFEIWLKNIRYISTIFVVGIGPQNTINSANSFLLQIGIYLGIPGILILIDTFLESIKKSKISENKIMIVTTCFFLLLCVSNSIYYINAYLFLFLGFCSSFEPQNKEKNNLFKIC